MDSDDEQVCVRILMTQLLRKCTYIYVTKFTYYVSITLVRETPAAMLAPTQPTIPPLAQRVGPAAAALVLVAASLKPSLLSA